MDWGAQAEMIERLTKQGQAMTASFRWDQQYERGASTHQKDIGRQLRAMPFPNPALVNAIVGNTSWTDLECDPCGRTVEAVTAFGPLYVSERHVYVCDDCLELARARERQKERT
jgi:hypothetical protein